MIKNIRFRNFYSFAEEAEISFEIGKQPGKSTYDVATHNGKRINKVAGVIGPNGAGKTQLLKILPFLTWFIVKSYQKGTPDDAIPFQPHRLKNEQSSFFCN